MRLALLALALSALAASAQNLFVYSTDGKKVLCNPRDIPANAVNLATRQPVLGMHSATPAIKAACGWYRVVPSAVSPGTNQFVFARAYTITGNTAVETLVISNRVRRTPRQRLDRIIADLDGADDDTKVKAAIAQIAAAIADRLQKTEASAK